MKIHIIEDDPILARGLQVNLELENHSVRISTHIKGALEAQQNETFDFIILDLGLPDGSGFDFLEKARAQGVTTPLIILTAQTDVDSVVKGLQLGANDYMKKPYSFKELRARISVILKKPVLEERKLVFENLIVNLDIRMVLLNEQSLDLNRREFDILAHFVRNAERIVSRESIIAVIDKESEISDRTIDSHVSHLRKKMRGSATSDSAVKISSVYGMGYRLEKSREN